MKLCYIVGSVADEYLGEGVCTGDVDGDGIKDLIIGASGKSFAGRSYAGGVYVIRGGAALFTHKTIDMSAPPADIQYYIIEGAAAGQNLGTSVAAGDINNDGKDDILVSAIPFFGDGEVYSLITNGNPFTNPKIIDLSVTTNFSRHVLAPESLATLGAALAVGDLNNDNYDEIIMSATMAGSMANKDSTGRVYIFTGSATPPTGTTVNLASASANITIKGRLNKSTATNAPLDFDYLGDSIAIMDFNNDGFKDLALGAPEDEVTWTDTQNDEEGFTYIIFGRTAFPSVIDLSVTGSGFTSQAFSIIGSDPENGGCGERVAGGEIDNINGEDLAILAVNAGRIGYDSESKVYVIQGNYGRAAGQSILLSDNPQSATMFGNRTYISSVMSLTLCNFNSSPQKEVFVGAPFYDKAGSLDDSGGAWGFYLFQPVSAVKPIWKMYE